MLILEDMKWFRTHFVSVGIGVVLIGALAYFGIEQWLSNSKAAQLTDPNTTLVTSAMSGTDDAKGDSPANQTTQPSLDDYKVAADLPRALYIQKLNIAARIMPMTTTAGDSIQAPINIHDSGWYEKSAKPDQPGAMFIDGHASGATRMGLFAYIDTLKVGDSVVVEKGDGTRLAYEVKKVESVPKDSVDMSSVLSPYDAGTKGLNLMTCTGTWIPSEKTYDHRVVVYTEQV